MTIITKKVRLNEDFFKNEFNNFFSPLLTSKKASECVEDQKITNLKSLNMWGFLTRLTGDRSGLALDKINPLMRKNFGKNFTRIFYPSFQASYLTARYIYFV